jgi:hypothetical protein
MYVDFAKLKDRPEKEPVISQSQGHHLKNSLVELMYTMYICSKLRRDVRMADYINCL